MSPRPVKPATLVAVVVLGIGVTAVIAGQSLIIFFARALNNQLPPIDREIVVVTAPFDPRNLYNIHDLAVTRTKIENAFPGLTQFSLFRAAYHPASIGERNLLKKVVGLDSHFFSVLGVSAASGRLQFRARGAADQDCAVSRQTLEQMALFSNGLAVLDIGGWLCRIVGIIDLSDPFVATKVDKNAIYAGFEFPAFEHSTSVEKGAILSFAPGTAPTEELTKRKLMPIFGVEHLEYWSYHEELARNRRLLGFVSTLTHGIAFVFLLVVTLNAAAFVSHSVAEREKEIGLKRALGATAPAIFCEIQTEMAWIGAVAFVLGLGLAEALVRFVMPAILGALTGFTTMSLQISSEALTAGLVAALVVPTAAAIAPAFRACKISPAIALRDD